MINLAIISGLSGAGKTYVISHFEENGYAIVENIPLSLIPAFYQEVLKKGDGAKVALSISVFDCFKAYELAKDIKEFKVTFLGLYCSKEVLLERYN